MKVLFRFNKWVRDNVLNLINKQNGKTILKTPISKDQLLRFIKEKIIEEAKEIKSANKKNEIIEEIADIIEAIDKLKSVLKISDHDVKIIKDKKNIINGSFDDNIIIDYVEVEKK